MIARGSYDLARLALRLLIRLWPVWLVYAAWSFAWTVWQNVLLSERGAAGYSLLVLLWPSVALLGPLALMLAAIGLYRGRLTGRTAAIGGIIGLLAAVALTVWPELLRLGPYVGQPGYPLPYLLSQAEPAIVLALVFGGLGVFAGLRLLLVAQPVGRRAESGLRRGRTDNFGHADWLSMPDARRIFPGPDPVYGGIVVGEAYRVDQDRVARQAFDPGARASWGRGGSAPLLIDPCRAGSTHALVLAGSGGFKTTSIGIPTLLTWTGSTVVLDPAREIGPMVTRYRRDHLGHRVVTLDPATAATSGINVLDWIDITAPLAETHVEAVVHWLSGETRGEASSGAAFFRDTGRGLIACLLADLLWDPQLAPERKTLRTLRQRLVVPENEMRELLGEIHARSASAMARDLAGTLKGLVAETFSGVYANANRDTRFLSTPAFGDLVSGGAPGSQPACHTSDLVQGRLTVFLQIPLNVLQATPALGRVLVGALLNAAYEADGKVQGRVLFLLDEVARLGFMQVLEQARDAGRKYGITLLLLYQSLGQLVAQWGREGKQAWYDSTAWRLFAAVQDPETARELSAMCGEYGVVAVSHGDNEGSQGRAGLTSSSAGRSETRSEIRRALIKPDELLQDTRADEAFLLLRGARPLRCGRAVWFRRPEWQGLVDQNRFHASGRDAAA